MVILKEHERIGKPDFVLFDFDGTISKLRSGWDVLMKQYMIECIPDKTPEIYTRVEQYIDESAGIQTVHQMKWLSDQVRQSGGKIMDPWDYKKEFTDLLMQSVKVRKDEIQKDRASAKRYLVHGSLDFLEALKERGIPMFLASGTDDEDTRTEAACLGVADYFEEIAGAAPHVDRCSKEATLRKLARPGKKMLIVGDGKVEISLGCEWGAVTLGVASWDQYENFSSEETNPVKARRLIAAGATALVADFREFDKILSWI